MTSRALIDEIDHIAEYKLQPFLAPIVDADTSYIFTIQGDAPYFLRVDKASPGWWIVNPTSNHTAEIGREAMPHEYIPYLDQLPRRIAYSLFQSDETSWMCMLRNTKDPPRKMHLVRFGLMSLESVAVHLAGDILLCGDTFGPAVSSTEELLTNVHLCSDRELRNAAKLIRAYRQQVEEERRKQSEAQMAESAEEGFRRQLRFANADLEGWRELPQGYEIRYSISGVEMPPLILGRGGKVITAGICLDGTDRYHNLTSIVHVMQQARRLRRFDLDEELWM